MIQTIEVKGTWWYAVVLVNASSNITGGTSQRPAVLEDTDPKLLIQDDQPAVYSLPSVGQAVATATYASLAGQIRASEI